MNAVLPHTTERAKLGIGKMQLVNHNSAVAVGPTVSVRSSKKVEQGVLAGWSTDAANVFLAPPKPLNSWDVSWGAEENYFENNVGNCSAPEEVEAILPCKWMGFKPEVEVDESLTRVCKLCTALVNRFVKFSSEQCAPNTTAKWREHQTLMERLRAVMELLEASIGEAVPILRLQDAAYVRECWLQLQEDERQDVLAALTGHEGV